MSRRRLSFAHLLIFLLYSNRMRLVGSAVVILIPLGYLLNIYFNAPGSLNNPYSSPADGAAFIVFIVTFSLMPAQALADKSMKLSLLGPYKRQAALFATVGTTLLVATLVMFFAVTVLSLANYGLTILSRQGEGYVPPALSKVVGVWLQRYLGYLGFFSYVMLFSFAFLVWGARILGETVNMIASLVVTFFIGAGLESQVMTQASAAPLTFTYYMYALGSIISGLGSDALGYPNLNTPLYLILFGILSTFVLFLSLAWIGFKRLDLRVE